MVEIFYEKELLKTNQTKFRVQKVIKKRGNKLYVKWKGHDHCLIVAQIKKISLYKISYFPELDSYDRYNVKTDLDLINYATKSDLKGATDINTSKFSKNIYLVSLKSKVDKINVDNVETVPNDLIKLSNVVMLLKMLWLKKLKLLIQTNKILKIKDCRC